MGAHRRAEAKLMTVLCRLDDLPNGTAKGFKVAGLPCKVIIVRRGNQVFGWRDLCPHYAGGTPMAWKRDAYLNGAGTHIACHAHGAWFDIETGQCTKGPCLGKRLTKVPLIVDDEGAIHIP